MACEICSGEKEKKCSTTRNRLKASNRSLRNVRLNQGTVTCVEKKSLLRLYTRKLANGSVGCNKTANGQLNWIFTTSIAGAFLYTWKENGTSRKPQRVMNDRHCLRDVRTHTYVHHLTKAKRLLVYI